MIFDSSLEMCWILMTMRRRLTYFPVCVVSFRYYSVVEIVIVAKGLAVVAAESVVAVAAVVAAESVGAVAEVVVAVAEVVVAVAVAFP